VVPTGTSVSLVLSSAVTVRSISVAISGLNAIYSISVGTNANVAQNSLC